jgi:hypothetical protein
MNFSLLIAWKMTPENFSCEAFCELRLDRGLGSRTSAITRSMKFQD